MVYMDMVGFVAAVSASRDGFTSAGMPLVSTRDDAELARLFTDRYAALCKAVYLLTGSREASEDAVMEGFLRVHRVMAAGRRPNNSEAYLFQTVFNVARTRLRRQIVERRLLETISRQRVREHRPDSIDVATSEESVAWALRQLPAGKRIVVVLRYVLDLTEEDIARLNRCSVGTVKSQLAKARQKLASVMAAEEESVRALEDEKP
jgi:RNA polymerase sigma factor (sigma-70 family)